MNDLEIIRPIIFLVTITLCFIAETLSPEFLRSYKTRFRTNVLLLLSSILVLKISLPFGIYGIASQLNGVTSLFILKNLPWYYDLLITILLFDFIIYWQHRLFHIIPFLWRFHEVHHCDKAMDLSTAFRFHPGEIIISAIVKVSVLVFLTPRIEVYLVYESILNSMAIFNHSNFKIAPKIEKMLRYIIVTPQMHYPHHSPDKRLTNLNYGNFLSIWDRIFKTFTYEANAEFGLNQIKQDEALSFIKQLALPFHPRLKE